MNYIYKDEEDELFDNIHFEIINLRNTFNKIELILKKKNIVNRNGIKISSTSLIDALIKHMDEYKEKGLIGGYMGLESNISSLQCENPGILKLTEFMVRKRL